MLSIFLVVFQLILSLSILFLSIGIIVYTIDSSRADAPFVPVRKRALERIIQALKLKSGSVVYDLG